MKFQKARTPQSLVEFFCFCFFVFVVAYGPSVTLSYYKYTKIVEQEKKQKQEEYSELNNSTESLKNLQRDVICLAQNIYFEAENEPHRGKEAIAAVTMNRIHDKRFPKTACAVVFQKNERGCQFSWTCDGKQHIIMNPKEFIESIKIAQDYLYKHKNRHIISNDVVYYHAYYIKPKWAEEKRPVANIGSHIFYR